MKGTENMINRKKLKEMKELLRAASLTADMGLLYDNIGEVQKIIDESLEREVVMIKLSEGEITRAINRVGKFVQIHCQDRKRYPCAMIVGVYFGVNGAIDYQVNFTDYGRQGKAMFALEEFEIIEAANPDKHKDEADAILKDFKVESQKEKETDDEYED